MIYSVFIFSIELFCNDKVASFTEHRNTSRIVTKQPLEGLKNKGKIWAFFPTDQIQCIKFEMKAMVEKNILKLQKVHAKGNAVVLRQGGGQGRISSCCFPLIWRNSLKLEEQTQTKSPRDTWCGSGSSCSWVRSAIWSPSPSFQAPENMGYMVRPP